VAEDAAVHVHVDISQIKTFRSLVIGFTKPERKRKRKKIDFSFHLIVHNFGWIIA